MFQDIHDPQQKEGILDDAIKDFDAEIEVDEDMIRELQANIKAKQQLRKAFIQQKDIESKKKRASTSPLSHGIHNNGGAYAAEKDHKRRKITPSE